MDRYKRYIPRTYPCAEDRMMPRDEEKYCTCTEQPMSLAMAYIPMQEWGEMYRCCEALEKGTLFPCLYKPYCTGGCRR